MDEPISEFNKPAWKAWKLSSTSGMMMSLFESHPNDENVMLGVAWNPVTPRHILSALTRSELERVRAVAGQRLGETVE